MRDPLWLLARQWQTGAFLAADAGRPVQVTLQHAGAPIVLDGAPLTGPIQPVVEAEPLPAVQALDTAARVRLAGELVHRLRDAGLATNTLTAVRAALARAFPLRPSAAESTLAVFTGRLPDPAGLAQLLAGTLSPDGTGGPFPTLPGVEPADKPTAAAVERAVRAWYRWLVGQLTPPGAPDPDPDPAAWDPQRLEYGFTATGAIPAGTVALHAAGYDGLGVDWYSFDRDPMTGGETTTASTTLQMRPVPVTYPGMPRPRFWEFEDGDVNLDTLRTGGDPAHAVLAAFAHQYTNDWFVVPLELPPGVRVVTALTVTDTFGTTTLVPAVAAIDHDRGPWRLWDLTSPSGEADAASGMRVILPPAPQPLEGPVLEEALLARDEFANLAWLIELTTRDRDGTTIDRHQRWLRLRPAADPTFNPAAANATRYQLGSTIPDFWYPLVAAPDSPADHPLLASATLPPEAKGVSDDGVQGHLVRHTDGSRLADEEATRQGTRLTRRDRVTLSPAGPVIWRARTKGPGQGESSSGLRFDILQQ